MPSLQDELNIVEQRENDFYKNHPMLLSLDKAIGNSEGLVFFAGIVAVFLGIFSVRWIFYHLPTWRQLLAIGFISYFPGFILASIFSEFFCSKYQNFLFRKYNTDKKTYEDLIKQRTEFRKQKVDLQVRIKKLRENNLKYNLNDFIDDLKRNKFIYSEAKNYQQLMEEEYKAVRKSSFYYHTSRYYTNRLVTIDSLLRDLLSNKTSKLSPKTTESNPYIPVKKQEETNKKIVTPTPLEEKKIIVTENKPIPEIKITSSIKKETLAVNPDNKKPVPTEQEKTSSELFRTSDTEVAKKESAKTYQPKPPVKVDFAKLNEHRHNIGELGELYVFEKEQNDLNSKGKITEINEVIHVSLKNDSEGYDIISFTDIGDRKYIEVKTTTGNEFEPFYLSTSEMDAMNRLNNYWIYRLYNFNIDLKKGDLYKIDCKKEFDRHFNIQASSFKVTPKR